MGRAEFVGAYEGADFVMTFSLGGTMTIQPDEVLTVGNSIGGYWAKPCIVGGVHRLSLIRISGSEKSLSPEGLRRRHSGERGVLLEPGRRGLWATSSGSARRGVIHWLREEPVDPIVQALRECGLPGRGLQVVENIDHTALGGQNCSHWTARPWRFEFRTDGTTLLAKEGRRAGLDHHNQYHRWCSEEPDTFRVTGGTYLVNQAGAVLVTKEADRAAVATVVREMNGRW